MFEFDKDKSITNKVKHGIDFKEAQMLWEDPNRILIPAKNIDEDRYMLIGKIGDSIWSAIFTLRNKNTRIISVRKARTYEKEIYEGL